MKKIKYVWRAISPKEKVVFIVDLTKSFIFNGNRGFDATLQQWEDTVEIINDKYLMEKIKQSRQRMAHLE